VLMDNEGRISYSDAAGTTWSNLADSPITTAIAGVGTTTVHRMAFGNEKYAVVGGGLLGNVMWSSDLVTWNMVNLGVTLSGFGSFNEIIFANGIFVIVGDSGACYTATDPAGPWTEQDIGYGIGSYPNGIARLTP
jgi:hypothetical protein